MLQIVIEEGGFDEVTRERRWSRIANRMNFCIGKGTGSMLRHHYERILYPYDVFQAGASLDPAVSLHYMHLINIFKLS